MLAVCGFDNIVYVEKAFNIVKDFTGRQFRYRQLSLSDFVDYLLLKFPTIFNSLCTSITTTLTCTSCGWLSFRQSPDSALKLYFYNSPMRKKSFLLQDLINRNSRVFLSGNNQVRCGKCKRDTPQESSCSFNGELILIEIVRVIFKDEKQRNDSSVFFPLKGISLPEMPGTFSPIATCHHTGSLDSGHWFARVRLSNDSWYEIDDTKGRHAVITSVGESSGSASLVMLMLMSDSHLEQTLGSRLDCLIGPSSRRGGEWPQHDVLTQ